MAGATSMHNLCFMSNLSSEEWAAWVQAVGSILAIIAAIWIASRQHRIAVAEAKRERVEQAERTARLSTIFGEQLLACVADMVRGCVYENRQLVGRALSRLHEVVQFSRSVDPAELPPTAIWPYMSLRVIAAQARRYAESVEANPSIGFRHAEQEMERFRGDASKSNLMLAAAFGDEIAKATLAESERARA